MSSLSALIQSRVSTPSLSEPVPDAAQLKDAFETAVRAPDHGKLRPWRFFVLTGEERHALGACFEAAGRARDPALDAVAAERFRNMPLRAPMIIVAAAKVTLGHKVPVWEQIVAVGAAVQNLSLALHEKGFSAMWRTGDMASDPMVKHRLGLTEEDQIVAFLYVGTATHVPTTPRADASAVVVHGMPRVS